ncbi:MAG: cysteine peptidase family C39 domain-containing protein, partial [Oligoflexus sp.]
MGSEKKKITFKLPIVKQPDDVTCGPTCLHSIYQYYNDRTALEQVIREVPMLETGGTYASRLGTHALKRGYQSEIWSFNVNMFDPSWFGLPADQMFEKLKLQRQAKKHRKLRTASDGYMEFLKNGGILRFEDLTPELLVSCLREGKPVIAGLSATYLYKSMREDPKTCEHNDVKGYPSGHFVVLTGIDTEARTVQIT